MTCRLCGRKFRDSKSRERAANYAAIHRELSGGEPARHLMPIISDTSPSKIERKREKSADFVAGRT